MNVSRIKIFYSRKSFRSSFKFQEFIDDSARRFLSLASLKLAWVKRSTSKFQFPVLTKSFSSSFFSLLVCFIEHQKVNLYSGDFFIILFYFSRFHRPTFRPISLIIAMNVDFLSFIHSSDSQKIKNNNLQQRNFILRHKFFFHVSFSSVFSVPRSEI